MDRMGIEGGSVALVGADAVLRPDLPSVTDAPPTSDAACQVALPATSDHVAEAFGQRLCPLNLKQLLALDIKPRGMVLDPIIPDKGLVMLYATRGTGKTHVALGIAHAVATGSTFLRWQAPRPRRVLLIAGEMPASALRERLQQLAGARTCSTPRSTCAARATTPRPRARASRCRSRRAAASTAIMPSRSRRSSTSATARRSGP